MEYIVINAKNKGGNYEKIFNWNFNFRDNHQCRIFNWSIVQFCDRFADARWRIKGEKMEVMAGKNAGFCAGVELAVNKAKEISSQGDVFCLGEIVHNSQVVQDLEKNGMKTVNQLEDIPDGSTVIFRAHGEPIATYQKAEKKGLKIVDLTCPNVKIIHQKVEKAKKESFILIIGNKNHPEILGTSGFAGENSYIIETEDDILDAYKKFEKTNLNKIFVVSQTTFSSQKFDDLADEIQTNFCEADVMIDKTICNSTENRQLEVTKIARNADVMLIIGGKNSSNTRKLFEISSKYCQKTYAIETVEDMTNIIFEANDKIGIMAGASTPKYVVEEVKSFLERKT